MTDAALFTIEDIKQDWQLDRGWEAVTKGRKKTDMSGTIVAAADRSLVEGRNSDDENENSLSPKR